MAARGSLTIIFPEQVQSVDTSSISSSSSITTSGESVTTTTDDGQTYSVAFTLVAGYKINGADFTPSVNGGIVDSFTNSTVDITAGAAGIDGTLTFTVQQSESTTVKTVSSDNLARFKQKCDETYAAIGNIPTVSTELVNLGTLSTSGTLTTDQVTQIGTTTIGVTARASVNGVTRFYERVNISGTTATLVSADDDALHVLTVNLSTRAYTLSDVALGGGGGPDIPTPTTADNGKVLGVANGAYALQEAGGGGGGTISGYTVTVQQGALVGVSSPSIVFEKADGTTQTVTSSDSSTIVNNVVKIWATIEASGNSFIVSGKVAMLLTITDANNKSIRVYSVYGNGSIRGMGG